MYAMTLNPDPSASKTREQYRASLDSSLKKARAGAIAVSGAGPKEKYGRDTGANEMADARNPGAAVPKALVVMPGNLGLLMALSWGDLKKANDGLFPLYKEYCRLPSSWTEEFLALHREAARRAGVYLVPGTYALREGRECFLASSLLSPGGEILLEQKQVFLSRLERSLGFSRGETLNVAALDVKGPETAGLKTAKTAGLKAAALDPAVNPDALGTDPDAPGLDPIAPDPEHGSGLPPGRAARNREPQVLLGGLMVGTDAFYPETGRILAMQGADVICHPGCLGAGGRPAGMKTGPGNSSIPWVQLTGMWQQVQQNQFFCIESQLHAVMAGNSFGAPSILHGPCEMTEGLTGILARGGSPGDPAAGFLNNEERLHVIKDYSILGLLNPAAYGPLGCPGGEEI